nr:MAG TPA: hypothetical protein [Crassvirales sp.]
MENKRVCKLMVHMVLHMILRAPELVREELKLIKIILLLLMSLEKKQKT